MLIERNTKKKCGKVAKGRNRRIRIVMVSSDNLAATRADFMVGEMVAQSDDPSRFLRQRWNVDELENSEKLKSAARAGKVASLLILAIHCDADLPASVLDWLERSIDAKKPRSAAMVALLELPPGSTSVHQRTRRSLENASAARRLGFFVHELNVSESWYKRLV